MRSPMFVCTAAVGLLCAALVTQVTSARAGEVAGTPVQPYYSFCRSNTQLGTTFYFSATRHIDAGVGRQDLENSFREYLARNYKYPNTNGVSCVFAVGGDLQANTESSRQQTINNLRSANFEVVETDWTYEK